MAVVSTVFFDTSILLGGLIEIGPSVRDAQEAMAEVAEGRLPSPLTAWHCCLEFYSVATRLPAEYRLCPEDARQLVEEEILARFRVVALPRDEYRAFWSRAASENVAGGRIYDRHIAEIARRAGARTVVTENRRHFDPLPREGIRVLGAAEWLASRSR